MIKKLAFMLVGCLLVFVIAACGEAEVSKVDKDKVIETSGESASKEKDSSKEQSLKIGDTVNFEGLEITLNEVRIEPGGEYDNPENDLFIVVNLTAENTTDEEQSVSSIMNVEFKDVEGYAYNTTFLTEGIKAQFDGSIEPGGKLRGEIPFDVPDSEIYELHYSNPFKSGKAIWKISLDQISK